jgi:tetratricopeptide (TPR) repeat protein
MAALLGNIGAAHLALGRLDSAETHLKRAAKLAEATGDLRVQANVLVGLAGLSEDRGDLAAAYQGYRLALDLHERIGDRRGMAADYNNLGLLAQETGDLKIARHHLDSALALNRADGRDEIAATNLVNLAGLAALSGNSEKLKPTTEKRSLFGRTRSFGVMPRRHWTGLARWKCAVATIRLLRLHYERP